jgi:hypothetical protein
MPTRRGFASPYGGAAGLGIATLRTMREDRCPGMPLIRHEHADA